jgi:hypothetical protein
MAQKNRTVRRIDAKSDSLKSGTSGLILGAAQPAVQKSGGGDIPPPEDLTVVSQTHTVVGIAPKVLVGLDWNTPPMYLPDLYLIQYSLTNNYSTGVKTYTTTTTDALIEMEPSTTYYIRVQCRVRGVYSEWSNTITLTTSKDLTPPQPVTGLTITWGIDEFYAKFTVPNDPRLASVNIRVAVHNGTSYVDVVEDEASVVGLYGKQFTYIMHGGRLNGLYSGVSNNVRVRVEPVSFNDVTGTAVSATSTEPALGAVATLTSSWDGDTAGTADEDLTITWSNPQGRLVEYSFASTKYTSRSNTAQYKYTQNKAENPAHGDSTLTVTARYVSLFGTYGPTKTLAVENKAPSLTGLSINANLGFSTLYATLNITTAIQDLKHFMWVLTDGVTTKTVVTTTPEVVFDSLNGTYTLSVVAVDLFNQSSATVSLGGLVLESITLEQLRSDAQYSDSIGTSPTTLATRLKNENTSPTGIGYTANTWHWIQVERELIHRFRNATYSLFSSAAITIYLAVSSDGSTWRYFAGPLDANSDLVEVANQSAAQTNAVTVNWDSGVLKRLSIAPVVEGRFVRLYFRSTSAPNARVYYPRRLVQSDDIEAQAIKAINIGANQITGDHLVATAINGMTITGATIQTSSTGARIVLSNAAFGGMIGYSATDTYNPTTGVGTYQVRWDKNSGALLAGGGAVMLNAQGMTINVPTGVYNANSFIRWLRPSTNVTTEIGSQDIDGTYTGMRMSIYDRVLGTMYSNFTMIADPTDPLEWSKNYLRLDIQNSQALSVYRSGLTTQGLIIGDTLDGAPVAGYLRAPNIDSNRISVSSVRGAVSIGSNSVAANTFIVDSTVRIFNQTTGSNSWFMYSDNNILRLLSDAAGGGTRLYLTPSGLLYGPISISINNSAQNSAHHLRIKATLDNASDFGIIYKMANDIDNNFQVQGDGTGYIRNSTGWNTGSDVRWKKNIRDLEDGLYVINSIRPRIFDYIEEERGTDIAGFIAQELQESPLSNIVSVVSESGYLGITMSSMIPYLVRAVQELYAMITVKESGDI